MTRRAYPKYKDSGVEWIGEIPEHWEIMRIRRIASLKSGNNIDSNEINDQGKYPVFGGNGLRGYTSSFTHDGHYVLIGRQGALCGNINYANGRFWASEHAVVVTPITALEIIWLGESLRSMNLNKYSVSAAQPGLAVDVIKASKIVIPPLHEQHLIAAFLDHETSRIDTLISKKERQIELLKEKRSALITHAVTKGLNPNAKMKDSGVEWIGGIPEHWKTMALRRVIEKFVDYRGRTPEKVESGIPLITARNIKNGNIAFSLSEEFIREEDYGDWMVRGMPQYGDVLITTEAPLGESTQIEDERIALAQRIILFKVNKEKLWNDYLKYHFLSLSGKGELWSNATGSTALGIKADKLKGTKITLPPFTEQIQIASFLDRETLRIDKLIDKVQNSIETLKEYRAAIISAAVTGKIDVRDWKNEATA